MAGMKRSSPWDLFLSDGLLIFYKSCEVLSNYCLSCTTTCLFVMKFLLSVLFSTLYRPPTQIR